MYIINHGKTTKNFKMYNLYAKEEVKQNYIKYSIKIREGRKKEKTRNKEQMQWI